MKKLRLAIIMILTLSMLFSTISFAATSKATKGVTPYNEYSANDVDGNMFLIVLVRNDGYYDCCVYMDAYAINSKGKTIETSTSDAVLLGPGDEYALVSTFKKSSNATNYDYKLVVDTNMDNYLVQPCSEFMDAKFSDDGHGTVTVYATNKSSLYTVEAQAIVLFYLDDQIIDFEEMYLSNDKDLLLSPGEATTEEGHTIYDYNASSILVNAVS